MITVHAFIAARQAPPVRTAPGSGTAMWNLLLAYGSLPDGTFQSGGAYRLGMTATGAVYGKDARRALLEGLRIASRTASAGGLGGQDGPADLLVAHGIGEDDMDAMLPGAFLDGAADCFGDGILVRPAVPGDWPYGDGDAARMLEKLGGVLAAGNY